MKQKSKINNKPTGKVKYKKLIGRRSKLLKLKSPITCFFAKSNKLVIPKIPYLLNETLKI